MPNEAVVYRKEIVVGGPSPEEWRGRKVPRYPMRPYLGAVQIVSPAHVYVFIDNEEVYRSDRAKENHLVVLSPFFSPGEHVIMVAASAKGFAMAGFFVSAGSDPVFGSNPLITDKAWKVEKFPPGTVFEMEAWCRPGFDDSGWSPVQVDRDRGLIANEDALVAAIWRDGIEQLSNDIAEAECRLNLISQKGIATVDDIAYYGWGPDRLSAAVLAATSKGFSLVLNAQAIVANLRTVDVRDIGSFRANRRGLIEAMRAATGVRAVAESATSLLYVEDELKNLSNAYLFVKGSNGDLALDVKELERQVRQAELYCLHWEDMEPNEYERSWTVWRKAMYTSRLARELRARMEKAWGHPLNRYNESRFSMMGWIPNADLVGGELGDWGLHVGEIEAPPIISPPGRWRFKTDPNDEGLAQRWHTIGLNIEGQWATMDVPGMWEGRYKDTNPKAVAQNPYPGKAEVSGERPYYGYAWYRTRVRVPDEWRGNDLELHISWANDWDWTFFNEQLVGKTGPETPNWTETPRRYSIPKDVVRFGEDNVIAIRVFDAGGEGGLGKVELRCPGLLAGGAAQPMTVVRSFLSPGILVKTPSDEITIWGKKQSGGFVLLPLRSGLAVRELKPGESAYSVSKDGKLAENWFLWSSGFAGSESDRPVEVVLEKNLSELRASEESERGNLTAIFAESGARVVLIRPLRARLSKGEIRLSERELRTCRFWAGALLEYPVGYTEMTRLDPQNKDFVQVFDMYNYESLNNAWGIKPLRLAPASLFLTYALKTGWPELSVDGDLADTGFDLRKYGNYEALPDSNIISYRYPRDKMLRLGGFTSWVFMPWDAGVPGNDRECEVVAQSGANSYRPQHNFAGEKARVFADYCNKYGLNYMNNPDNELGGKGGKRGENVEAWVNHYRELAGMFKNRPEYAVAYDLINEAANMKPEVYNPLIERLTEEIRRLDPLHLIYVETCNSWGAVEQFPNLGVTGDARTIYSFHDYNFRLRDEDRYPSLKWDIQQMYKRWMPAFDFQIKNHVRIHLGEFGGYEKGGEFNPCAVTMLHDVFRIADQFNWHFNYYPGRGIAWPRADGSLRPNTVFWGFKRYFDLGYFNMYFTPEERKIIR
jgi:hypothetical protein